MRATRDLIRRRLHLVRKRGQLLAHIQNTRAQYNLPAFGRRLAYPANRDGRAGALRRSQRAEEHRRRSDVGGPVRHADHRPRAHHRHARPNVTTPTRSTACDRCRASARSWRLTILYEIHDITRFDRVQEFASYARLVKGQKQSAGKTFGTSGAKMGNVHLKWAFSEAAVLFLRHTKDGKKLLAVDREETRQGKGALHPRAQDRAGRVTTCWRAGPSFRQRSSARRNREGAGEPDV